MALVRYQARALPPSTEFLSLSTNTRCASCSSASELCRFLPAHVAAAPAARSVVREDSACFAYSRLFWTALCTKRAVFALQSAVPPCVLRVAVGAVSRSMAVPCQRSRFRTGPAMPFLHEIFVLKLMLLGVTTAALASPSARSMLRCFYAVNRVVSVFVAPLAVRYAIRRVWLSLLSRSLLPFGLWGLPQAIRD